MPNASPAQASAAYDSLQDAHLVLVKLHALTRVCSIVGESEGDAAGIDFGSLFWLAGDLAEQVQELLDPVDVAARCSLADGVKTMDPLASKPETCPAPAPEEGELASPRPGRPVGVAEKTAGLRWLAVGILEHGWRCRLVERKKAGTWLEFVVGEVRADPNRPEGMLHALGFVGVSLAFVRAQLDRLNRSASVRFGGSVDPEHLGRPDVVTLVIEETFDHLAHALSILPDLPGDYREALERGDLRVTRLGVDAESEDSADEKLDLMRAVLRGGVGEPDRASAQTRGLSPAVDGCGPARESNNQHTVGCQDPQLCPAFRGSGRAAHHQAPAM